MSSVSHPLPCGFGPVTCFDQLHISESDRADIQCAPAVCFALDLGHLPREERAQVAAPPELVQQALHRPAKISRAVVAPRTCECGDKRSLPTTELGWQLPRKDCVCKFCSAEPKGSSVHVSTQNQVSFILAFICECACLFCKCFLITLGIKHCSRETHISLCVCVVP